jgi:hypothetical protein
MMRGWLWLLGMMGALLSGGAWAQGVPIDNNGFSPFNTQSKIVSEGQIRSAPALGFPSIYGLNPCSLGASVGVTTPLFGVGGAISTTDKDCETRNTAAIAITGLKDEVAAREILCEIEQFRKAVARLGKPCLVDQSPEQRNASLAGRATASAAPNGSTAASPAAATTSPTTPAAAPALPGSVVPTTPAGRAESHPASGTTTVAAASPAPVLAANAPDFCRYPGLQLSLYPECTGAAAPQPRASARPVQPAAMPRPAALPAPNSGEVTRTASLTRPGCDIPPALAAFFPGCVAPAMAGGPLHQDSPTRLANTPPSRPQLAAR